MAKATTKTADTKGTKAKGKKAKKVKSLSVAAVDVRLSRKATATDASVRTDARGVVRHRAKLLGHSVSAVWRWMGYNGWTLEEVKNVRDAAGLSGVISDGNCKCQHYDGVRLKNGMTPLYATGGVDSLPTLDKGQIRELVTLANRGAK